MNVHTFGGRWGWWWLGSFVDVVVVCLVYVVNCLISVQLLLYSGKNINKKIIFCGYLSVECLIYSYTFNNVHICSVAQSCSTLCDPMDYTPPGSSVHGIFQARILEWVAISYPKGHLIIQTLFKVRTVCKHGHSVMVHACDFGVCGLS